ncbi:MAG: hypothetical protein V6Z86_03675 [Hyphomicrobiales bacterium]
MSVHITETPGAAYTWATSAFDWQDAEAGKGWSGAHVAAYAADAGEALPVAGLGARIAGPKAISTLDLADVRIGEVLAHGRQTLALAETYVDYINFILSVAENLALGEVAAKNTRHPEGEGFNLVDTGASLPAKNFMEPLALADALERLAAFRRDLAEAVALTDAEAKTSARLSIEAFALVDALLRHANAVLADLAVRSTSLDETGFRDLVAEKGPLGYGPFRDLVPGDYEYAKALIGLLLSAPVTGERVAIADAVFNVDVPDVRDRGTASIPVTGGTVAFNRGFTEPPEVQVTLKAGATPALPEITAITTTGFDVRLFDAADGVTLVAGAISWSALGY